MIAVSPLAKMIPWASGGGHQHRPTMPRLQRGQVAVAGCRYAAHRRGSGAADELPGTPPKAAVEPLTTWWMCRPWKPGVPAPVVAIVTVAPLADRASRSLPSRAVKAAVRVLVGLCARATRSNDPRDRRREVGPNRRRGARNCRRVLRRRACAQQRGTGAQKQARTGPTC